MNGAICIIAEVVDVVIAKFNAVVSREIEKTICVFVLYLALVASISSIPLSVFCIPAR
jgi:hypothetical protein